MVRLGAGSPWSWEGLVSRHSHPRHPGLQLGSESLSPGGSAYFSSSRFRGLSLSQPMPTSTSRCRRYQTLISPHLRSPVVPGDPQQDVTPPFQAAIDRQAPLPSAGAALQTPLPSALGRTSIPSHLSCPRCASFPAELQPGCSLPTRLLFPVPATLTDPHPPVPRPCCQLLLPSCLSFPTSRAQTLVTLQAAPPQRPGWEQLCQGQGTPGWPNPLCQG